MLDQGASSASLTAQAAPRLPVDRLCIGREVEEVRALVPRIFNLCRDAQAAALDAALGRRVTPEAATQEVLRDHLIKFFVTWPGMLGLGAGRLPTGWTTEPMAVSEALFGQSRRVPGTWEEFQAFLGYDTGIAPVLGRIRDGFAPGEAVANDLPLVTHASIWDEKPLENSVAARHADHPVMQQIEATFGRGPFWRATARAYDVDAALSGDLAPVFVPEAGRAIATAARGAYALCVQVENERVTALTRVTPTDHLLVDGGVLDRSLATLPSAKAAYGPLVLDILDPCSPVRLREVGHA